MSIDFPTLHSIRTGGKPAIARALALIEVAEDDERLAALLDQAARSPIGAVLGLTGPPGVGKSTLTNALIARARLAGQTVAVIAVDPSSQITGGALLGDRTRLRTDPEDAGIFVRSMAARNRLGGLSDHAIAAIVLMRALYDLVIVESVGVGQSEGDIANVVDIVLLLIQPGSGDSLQFMKAGIMELPDLVAVTKADMGEPARRALADVEGAMTLSTPSRPTAVYLVSATTGFGVDELIEKLVSLQQQIAANGTRSRRRAQQTQHWVKDRILRLFGTEGAALIDFQDASAENDGPFSTMSAITRTLRRRIALT